MASHFKQSFVDEHDYEASASPMAAGSISKLHAGEGARKFASTKKREASKPARGVLIGVAIAALLVIVGGFFVVRAILGTRVSVDDEILTSEEVFEPQQAEVSIDEQTGSVETSGIEYMGEHYSLVAVEGSVGVIETDANGNQRTLFVLNGTPATMLFYDGVLLVPENLADGWDVIAFVVGGESQPTPVMGADGAAINGAGEISEAHLEGAELVVSDSTGATTRIPL